MDEDGMRMKRRMRMTKEDSTMRIAVHMHTTRIAVDGMMGPPRGQRFLNDGIDDHDQQKCLT